MATSVFVSFSALFPDRLEALKELRIRTAEAISYAETLEDAFFQDLLLSNDRTRSFIKRRRNIFPLTIENLAPEDTRDETLVNVSLSRDMSVVVTVKKYILRLKRNDEARTPTAMMHQKMILNLERKTNGILELLQQLVGYPSEVTYGASTNLPRSTRNEAMQKLDDCHVLYEIIRIFKDMSMKFSRLS